MQGFSPAQSEGSGVKTSKESVELVLLVEPRVKLTPKKHGRGSRGRRAQQAITRYTSVTTSRGPKRKAKDSETVSQSKRQRLSAEEGDTIYSAHNITTSSEEGSPRKSTSTKPYTGKGKQRRTNVASVYAAKKSVNMFGRGEHGAGSDLQYSSTDDEREMLRRSKRVSFVDSDRTESSDLEERDPSHTRSGTRGKNVGGRQGAGTLSTTVQRSPVKRKSRASMSSRSAPGLEETAESSSGGESGGGKRASVQEVKVSGSSAAKWQPISEEASKMLSNAMLSALGQCVTTLSGSRKQQAEHKLQEVISRVKQKLQSAKGPTTGRMKFYSGVKQSVAELKEKCLGLVQRNSDLEQTLEDRKRVAADQKEKTERLLEVVSSVSTTTTVDEFPDPPEEASTDEDAFMNYIVHLAENSRVACSRRKGPFSRNV